MVSYKDWIVSEAIAVASDKCTFALDWNVWCCYEHDLACLYAKDPRDAYLHWQAGCKDYWLQADYMRRSAADKRFWRCNRELDPSIIGKLRGDARYLGVRAKGILNTIWPF